MAHGALLSTCAHADRVACKRHIEKWSMREKYMGTTERIGGLYNGSIVKGDTALLRDSRDTR